MRSLDVNYSTFEKLNTVPLGLSVDPTPSKKAWAVAISLSKLAIPSDFWPHGKLAQQLGIFNEKYGFSDRVNIIIDEQGIVKWVKVYPSNQLPDINEVIYVLSQM